MNRYCLSTKHHLVGIHARSASLIQSVLLLLILVGLQGCSSLAPVVPKNASIAQTTDQPLEVLTTEYLDPTTGLFEEMPLPDSGQKLLQEYFLSIQTIDTAKLTRREALHFWVNTRNALAAWQAANPDMETGVLVANRVYSIAELQQKTTVLFPGLDPSALGNGHQSALPIRPLSFRNDWQYLAVAKSTPQTSNP
jgi:hypothetical protein